MTPQELLEASETLTRILTEHASHPHGPVVEGSLRAEAGQACVKLAGSQDKGRTLWKLIAADYGYMPEAAATALVRASNVTNLVPDVEAPEPT